MSENGVNQRRLPVLVNMITQEKLVLDGPQFHVGRAPSNAVILAEDSYASGVHARIYWEEGAWWVQDLKSSNGTTVDGQIITEPCRLKPGDVMKFGRTKFRIE